MNVQLKMYAGLKDHFGDSLDLDMHPEVSIAGLKNRLFEISPSSFELLEKCRFAINQEFAACETRLNDGDVIDILPPSSGG